MSPSRKSARARSTRMWTWYACGGRPTLRAKSRSRISVRFLRSLPDTDATFWTGTPESVAETMLAYQRIGFGTFIVELPAPYDLETMTTLIEVVRPMVEAA